MTLSIRRARADDSVSIADVHIASWRAGYKDLLPRPVLQDLTHEYVEARWRLELDRPPDDATEVLVIEKDGRIIAYSRYGPARDEDSIAAGHTWEVYGFYVHPDVWGKGMARDLMSEVLQRLKDLGCTDVTLNVVEGNTRARVFYERTGFVPDKPASPWYGVAQVRYRLEL